MWDTFQEQSFVLLIAVPYIGAWWWALRCVFGKRLVPWEWVPLAIASMGVPLVLREAYGGPAYRNYGNAIVACWMALPVPVILGHLILRWVRRISVPPSANETKR